MVPDLAFLHREHAERYIDEQPGVMGRKAKWSQKKSGDWEIRTINVIEHDVVEEKLTRDKLKVKALSKLTEEEKEVLGLLNT